MSTNISTVRPEALRVRFQQLYGVSPRLFRAPGRVNLIGEHTDYNDGFVMPAAIHLSTWVGAANRTDRRLSVYSDSYKESREFDLSAPVLAAQGHWSDYVIGVAVVLKQAGCALPGADLLIQSDVPIGSGLSSSAALEVATGFALLALAGHEAQPAQLARLCQRAENEFVGMRCGIMDQFIACHGQADHAVLLDCRSLTHQPLPLPSYIRLVICNTMVKHALASGEYNARRAECEQGVRLLHRALPQVKALRDVTPEELQKHAALVPQQVYRRCRHVIHENARVEGAALALQHGDLQKFGQLMNRSHLSLKEDYQVSCRELDLMVELAGDLPGVIGARMTGGGFGGCTINLVEDAHVADFAEQIQKGYQQATGKIPDVYVCRASAGVQEQA